MKKLQNKYDIFLIIIIILSLFSSILLLVTETTAQYSGWMFYLKIFATVLSFIPLVLTLILKSDKKYFAITATIVWNLILLVLCARLVGNNWTFALPLVPTIVILILSCIYLGVNISKQKRNENIVSVENSKQKTQISLEQGAKELKNLKELFDIGVFSEQEYTLQKNKIFGAMGVERNTPKPVQSATQSTVAIPHTPTETIEQPSMNQIIPDGNYDVGAMILSLSMRTFTFTKKDTNANCSTGTFTYDNDGNVLTLFTTDGSKMQLSIDQNGNLVTPRGTTYRKI